MRRSGRTARVRTVVSDDRNRVVAVVAGTVAVPAGATVAAIQTATVHRPTRNTALDKAFPVQAGDGVLDLEFVPRSGSATAAASSVSPQETP